MANVDLTRGISRRIYSGGLRDGRRINSVSVGAVYWFLQMHAAADDYGNVRGNPKLLIADAAPRRASKETSPFPITPAKVAQWLGELSGHQLIAAYEVAGEQFFHISKFVCMQPAGRNGKRVQRYPGDPWSEKEAKENPGASGESGCIQVNPDSSGFSSTCPSPIPTPTSKTNKQDQVQAGGQVVGPEDSASPPVVGGWLGKRDALLRLGINGDNLSACLANPKITPEILATVARQAVGKKLANPGGWAFRAIEGEIARSA